MKHVRLGLMGVPVRLQSRGRGACESSSQGYLEGSVLNAAFIVAFLSQVEQVPMSHDH